MVLGTKFLKFYTPLIKPAGALLLCASVVSDGYINSALACVYASER